MSKYRHSIVFSRGKIPADVLFIGEGPGQSEDVIGQPFVGPAGELLDMIIDRSLGEFTWCLSNLVMCLPWNEEKRKIEAPEHDCVMACKPRLEYFARLVNPRLIVAVGKPAEEYTDPNWKDAVKLPEVPLITIVHPSWILRSKMVDRSLNIDRCRVTLRNAVAAIRNGEEVPNDRRAVPF